MKFPKILESRLKTVLWADFDAVMQAFRSTRIASFRINTLKANATQVLDELGQLGIEAREFSQIPGSYIIDREQEYALKWSTLFRQGYIYMQSLASMLPATLLEPKDGQSILDVCSAPGSKTTQLAALSNDTAHIIALEQNQIRYDKLLHNIRLQGALSITAHKTDARKYLTSHDEAYDAILLDAPCSAEGRISLSDERTYGFFSLENIRNKSDLQKDLASHAFQRLRAGGKLVYSTCTLAPEENEEVVQYILDTYPQARILPIHLPNTDEVRPGMTSFDGTQYASDMASTVRILPSERFEGFFIALIGFSA